MGYLFQNRGGKTLIASIYWLQFYTDTSLWTLCADKYKVHEYVKSKGLENILNPLYGAWKNPDDIDWDNLPNQFVLKTNNSSGQIIIVKDKNNINRNKVVRQLKDWLKKDYGTSDAQLHYTKIPKLVIVEKLLDSSNGGTTDYKIWCINGKPRYVLVCHDRWETEVGYKTSFFDLHWNDITGEMRRGEKADTDGDKKPSCPKSFNKMLEYAEILAEGFPEVRVDFYEQNGSPVFGELTFTTGYGGFSKKLNEELGKDIDLSLATKVKHMNRLKWYK